jgi:hypothetical protein
MIKTPLSTVIGGAFWTPGATVIGGAKLSFEIVIKKLFSNNEQGFFYDPNDLSTMYQDAAGTVPVTDVGQSVGLIRDKSGRNNHAYPTTSASRPILRKNSVTGANYLEFDGSDDFLQTNNIDFTATDKVSLFAGARKLSDAAIGAIMSSRGGNGSFEMYQPSAVGNSDYVLSTSGSTGSKFITATPYVAPNSSVLTAKADIGLDLRSFSVSGKVFTGVAEDLGTGNYGNYPLYIGRRGGTSLPFNGHIYSLIGIGRLTTDSETVAIEKELAKRVGVTLNV